MPSLGGATEWLDSESLGPAELRGRAVLVNLTRSHVGRGDQLRQCPGLPSWPCGFDSRHPLVVVPGLVGRTVARRPDYSLSARASACSRVTVNECLLFA